MSFKNLIVERNEAVVTITLNRPDKLNALNFELIDELGKALNEISIMTDARAVIIKGAGRAFSSGTDLEFIAGGGLEEAGPRLRYQLGYFQSIFNRIEALEKPVIAQIHGYALGGAFELMIACDFKIATLDAKFALPQVKYGMVTDMGGTQRLVRAIGQAKAKEIVVMGRTIDGSEAERIGLINKAVAAEALEDEVAGWIKEILELPPLSVGLSKRAVDKSIDTDFMTALDISLQMQSELFKTEDYEEGLKAKLEKRAPVFKGR
ncbi:enoyl-CoA hydratase/isomerase family protein [Thermodesulfobacteriota bacterium]